MKKSVFTIILALCAFLSFSQTATKALQTAQLNTLVATMSYENKTQLYLDSLLHSQDNILTYTLSATCTNTGTTYTNAGLIIGGSSNYTFTVPNGVYELDAGFYGWGNGISRPDVFAFAAYNGTVTANLGDNTAAQQTTTEVMDKLIFTGYSGGLMSGYAANNGFMAPLFFNQTYNNRANANANIKPRIKITNGRITLVLFTVATTAPGNTPIYNFKFLLRPIKLY